MRRVLIVVGAALFASVLGCQKSSKLSDKIAEGAKRAGPRHQQTTPEIAKERGAAAGADAQTEAATPTPEPRVAPKTRAARPRPGHLFTAVEAMTDNPELRQLLKQLEETGKARSLRQRFETLRGQGSVAALLAALNGAKPNVRSQAAVILNRMDVKSRAFSSRLEELLLSDPDPDVRGVAGRVLVYFQRHKKRWNTPALVEALTGDETEAVRMHAAWALGASHDPKGVTALVGALEDPSTDVRLRCVGALKRIKSRRALPYLVKRLRDNNSLVRQRAREALVKIRGKNLGDDAAWERAHPAPNNTN